MPEIASERTAGQTAQRRAKERIKPYRPLENIQCGGRPSRFPRYILGIKQVASKFTNLNHSETLDS